MINSTAEPNTSFVLISNILQILRQNKGTLIILEMTYIILRLFWCETTLKKIQEDRERFLSQSKVAIDDTKTEIVSLPEKIK
ncbi:hypothetical protein [Arenibacter sp. F20364]|uniref:hypothetical protein n=1 Tax=Arenibacter sp. F20364 TaxID=2926415 RepID=UPI001FF2FE86|nr:hypothetical protein [Arenibacter sp. F20364]MCK0192888.1 hypothetical protein [Arenibacter sp. F20364]